MEDNSVKHVSLLSDGTYLDVDIDIPRRRLTILADNKHGIILSVKDNVVYMAGKTPNVQNVVVYDDKFAVLGRINARNLFYFQPMSIWHAPKSKFLYFEVAKNACSSMVAALYRSNWKRWWSPKISENQNIWDITRWRNSYFEKKYLLSDFEYQQQKDKFSDYRKILVYDDPLKRFLRALNNKHINHHTIASMIRPPYDKNIHNFIDKVVLVAKLDSLNEFSWDQHLAPISLNGANYLDDITDFVHLSDLNRFMLEHFGIKMTRHNSMPSDKKVITEDILLPYQIERIKAIYAKDYEIPQKYADKFYKAK